MPSYKILFTVSPSPDDNPAPKRPAEPDAILKESLSKLIKQWHLQEKRYARKNDATAALVLHLRLSQPSFLENQKDRGDDAFWNQNGKHDGEDSGKRKT